MNTVAEHVRSHFVNLDWRLFAVVGDEARVFVTPTEFRILRYLMEHRDRLVPPQELWQEVWGLSRDSCCPRLIRVHIYNLRAKLRKASSRTPEFIQTRIRQGYIFCTDGYLKDAPASIPLERHLRRRLICRAKGFHWQPR